MNIQVTQLEFEYNEPNVGLDESWCIMCWRDTPHFHELKDFDEHWDTLIEWELKKQAKANKLAHEQAIYRKCIQDKVAEARAQNIANVIGEWMVGECLHDAIRKAEEAYIKKHPCNFCRDLPHGAENLKYGCDEIYGLIIDMQANNGDGIAYCPSCERVMAAWE